jgi:UDP-N-acetylmuramoyl-tripeptide--D-alanyl-D-alanine ligase
LGYKDIGGYKIINDSYNANPESMKAVIKTVLDLYSPPLVIIIGDMGELGDDEKEFHKQIGEFIAEE